MTARFYEKDNTYRYENGDYDVALGEENFFAHLHETVDDEMNCQPTADYLMDRVGVLDTRDQEWWTYWRYDHEDDFPTLEYIARKLGTVLIRQTALPSTIEIFQNQHQFSDTDFDSLLE
jgi:hypothetical protein